MEPGASLPCPVASGAVSPSGLAYWLALASGTRARLLRCALRAFLAKGWAGFASSQSALWTCAHPAAGMNGDVRLRARWCLA